MFKHQLTKTFDLWGFQNTEDILWLQNHYIFTGISTFHHRYKRDQLLVYYYLGVSSASILTNFKQMLDLLQMIKQSCILIHTTRFKQWLVIFLISLYTWDVTQSLESAGCVVDLVTKLRRLWAAQCSFGYSRKSFSFAVKLKRQDKHTAGNTSRNWPSDFCRKEADSCWLCNRSCLYWNKLETSNLVTWGLLFCKEKMCSALHYI